MHRTEHRSAIALVYLALATSCVDIVGPDVTPTIPPRTTATDSSQSDGGVLRIVVTTSGTDVDPDGYTVDLTPTLPALRDVPANGGVDVALPVGTYLVTLRGLATNCAITPQGPSGTTLQIQVPRSSAAQRATLALFVVTCEPIPVARLAPGTQLAFVRRGQIWRVDADGSNPVQLTTGPDHAEPAWSPDGQRIAFSRLTERLDLTGRRVSMIYVMDADGSNVVQLTQGPVDRAPSWAPDSRRIAFASRCGGQGCVLVVSADPSDTSRVRVGWNQGEHESPAWSPDGTRIAFISDAAAYDYVSDLFVLTLGDASIVQLTSTFRAWNVGPIRRYEHPAWSPDGRQLAVIGCPPTYYVCDVSFISVMNVDGTGQRWLPTRGTSSPTWSPDARTIAFGGVGSIQWISADGSQRGIIIADGTSPAWRPSP